MMLVGSISSDAGPLPLVISPIGEYDISGFIIDAFISLLYLLYLLSLNVNSKHFVTHMLIE